MNVGYLVAGSLFFLGISLFFYFATRKNYYKKPVEPIQDYEDTRDKLTLRKKKEVIVKESGYGGGGILGNIIGGFIVIMIGTTLLKPIANQVNIAYNQTQIMNVTTSTTTFTSEILSTVPFFFMLGFIVVALSLIYLGLKNSGLV